MAEPRETAALIALLQRGRRAPAEYAELVEAGRSPLALLSDEVSQDGAQISLLSEDPEPVLTAAEADLAAWTRSCMTLLTVLDEGYPVNLRAVHDRPPLLFVAGRLRPDDAKSVAVVGSRRASAEGARAAAGLASELAAGGFTIFSGLAAGIDAAAHEAVLAAGGRTVAVIGTGLRHCYPPENAALQREIAERGAVISQLWPDTPPARTTFPERNALMSGLTRGTVIVEASVRSGARVQARRALAHGRPVFVLKRVLGQAWADELAARPGVHVVEEARQIIATVERLGTTDELNE